MASTSEAVAVIDVGSNTIKLLVAGPGDPVETLHHVSLETRISAGISKEHPRIAPQGLEAGLAAIQILVERARQFEPSEIVVAATSAVRDAQNRKEFMDGVKDRTGIDIRILTGAEEALYIGRGAAQDPELKGETHFYLADLGGGSLELIEYDKNRILQATSLRLGAVRMMEKYLDNHHGPIEGDIENSLRKSVTVVMKASGFRFSQNNPTLVGAGGAVNYARLLLADRAGKALHDLPARIPVEEIRGLYEHMASLSLEERRHVEKLPPARADIFPVSLLTLLTVAEVAGADAYFHSFYNLRYGIASELLDNHK